MENTLQLIQDYERQLIEAQRHSDVIALDRLIHDQLVFITPDGKTCGKEDDLEAHRSRTIKIDFSEAGTPSITPVDADTVNVSVIVQLKGSYAGQAFGGSFAYLRVWKKTGENWKIIAGSCLMLPA